VVPVNLDMSMPVRHFGELLTVLMPKSFLGFFGGETSFALMSFSMVGFLIVVCFSMD
jgi:hypothetical protein